MEFQQRAVIIGYLPLAREAEITCAEDGKVIGCGVSKDVDSEAMTRLVVTGQEVTVRAEHLGYTPGGGLPPLWTITAIDAGDQGEVAETES